MRGPVKWIGLALLGLAIAGGVAFAAGHLVSQQIGIASESISAGDNLAPSVRSAAAGAGSREEGQREAGAGETTETAPELEPTEPVEPEPTPTEAETAPTTPQSPEHGEDHGGGGGGADD